MMIHNKFVVAIKHDGKILREIGDVVKLPFGSEFTVLVKNLHSRRAKFKLHIDGTDVLDGTEIIVNAHSETEIKRFIRSGNMNEGNAFKFIERTTAIENGPRGIKADDGIVRVEYWFEKEIPEVKYTYHKDIWWNEYHRGYPTKIWGNDPFWYDVKYSSGMSGQNIVGASSANLRGTSLNNVKSVASATSVSDSTQLDAIVNDAGITVPGSKVEQKFTAVYGFNSETQSNVIILRLVGKTADDVEIVKPVTVKTKNKCVTCGRVNKATAKFCTDCGTALELL